MGYSNPSLAWALSGGAGVLLWLYGCNYEWPYPQLRAFAKKRCVGWIGCAVIAFGFGTVSLRAWGPREPTNSEVVNAIEEAGQKTVEDVKKELDAMLSGLSGNELRRLEQEYSLGFVLIAFSGEVKKVLPYSNVVEGDWDGLMVHRAEGNVISIYIPYLRDLRPGGTILGRTTLGIIARPGNRQAFPLKNVDAWVECVKAEPVGICAVLGFTDRIAPSE